MVILAVGLCAALENRAAAQSEEDRLGGNI